MPGETRRRSGASLIVVVLAVAVAAGAAVYIRRNAATTRQKAYVAAMKSDLMNLSVTQERYYARMDRYTSRIDSLGFEWSKGVRLRDIVATRDGWSATITHDASPNECSIAVGASVGGATLQGEPTCR